MIDFRAERAVYQQLADLLREEIASGRIGPGELLPSSKRLEQEHGVSRETVRRALAVLRGEGLIVTEPSYGTRVRVAEERKRVSVPRGASVISRPATAAEREQLDIPLGGHVLVVMVGGRVRGPVHAADRTELTTA
ncbi:winged helix-turn-helix domain-containing protein [Micromonospora sp. KC213]|uniref:GntR family transcriptional regulator n=1 Tax=Micromonospora sp. KC213 TaxID=2530378 RepID=UPI001052FA7D|nr:winged helix-turn-helix domain-containing protein [Micromonospora sp. KC213]TDC42111.1 GntR family transcriptional regulator [Micromonospora sp. KC213]